MKITSKIFGTLLVGAALLASCKKGPELNILDTGNFGETGTALKDAADFPIGAGIDFTPMISDPKYSETVKRDFDAVTFGYHMKHGAIVQDNGTMNFTNTDALVAAAGTMDIFGHTLGWHQNQNATYLKTFAGIVLPAATELATNPGFESGLTGWPIFNLTGATITATNVSGEVRTGTSAMKVVNPTAQTGNQWKVQVSSTAFTTVPGTQYMISYWVKAAAAGGSIRLSSGPTAAQYQGDQTIGTAYQLVTWTITASLTSTTFLFDMGQVANTYYIDDVSVKEVIPAPSGATVATKLDLALGNFITAIVTRYKAKVHAWDVVNELFADDGNLRNNSNTSPTPADVLVWSNYLGRDYAFKAFQYAKAADPTADLYINDYNLESSSVKLDSLLKMVAELKTRGAKVDGIGTQMHISKNTSYAGIDAMMVKLGATGLKIRISELDVKIIMGSAAGKPTPELSGYQAAIYKYVVSSYLKNIPKAQQAGITIWGVNDKNSWLYNSGTEFPLLYDNDYNKKPAYAGFLQGLKQQ
jgi:endo-1,4-beta-xylanase